MNVIAFPYLNPLRMIKATNTDELYWADKYPRFEAQKYYSQKWQQNDTIRFQFFMYIPLVDLNNIMIELRDTTYNQTVKVFSGEYFWPWQTYYGNLTVSCDLSNVPEGCYYVSMKIQYTNGTFDLFYSEPQNVAATQEYTVKLQYTNSGNDFDMFFLTSIYALDFIKFQMRVEGGFRSDGFQPSSLDTIYADQLQAMELLSSYPYNVRRLTIAGNKGVPEYIADKVNRIFCCTDVVVDDGLYIRQMCKMNGAAFEGSIPERYPMGIWNIDLVETGNPYNYGYDYIKVPAGIGNMQIIDESGEIVVTNPFIVSKT